MSAGPALLAHAVDGGSSTAALGWALACCAVLAVSTWVGHRTVRRASAAALALTGGLLVGMVAWDLLPEALAGGAEQGLPATGLLAATATTAGAFWWLGRTGCAEHPAAGWRRHHTTLTASALSLHRLAEGATLGLAATTQLRTALVLAVALGVHGSCEGAVLSVSLSSARRPPRQVLRWVLLLGATPFVGVAWGLADPSPELGAWTLAALSGLLLSAGTGNLRQAAVRLSSGRSVGLGLAGLGVLALTSHLAG